MKNKKDKSFWLLVAGIACIVIYILIPLSKIIGIIDDYDSAVTNIFLIAGAAFYIASRKGFRQKTDEENTSAPEDTDADDSDNID